MANEIWTDNFPSGNNLDAYVRKKTDDKVFDEADSGNTFETWVDGNVANYDIPMNDNGGDYYSVDFPTIITTAGVYRVVIALREGGTAAVSDKKIAQGELYWNGSAEQNFNTLSAQGSRVLNKYPTRSQPDV